MRLGAHRMGIAEKLHVGNFESGMESPLRGTALNVIDVCRGRDGVSETPTAQCNGARFESTSPAYGASYGSPTSPAYESSLHRSVEYGYVHTHTPDMPYWRIVDNPASAFDHPMRSKVCDMRLAICDQCSPFLYL